MQGEFLHKHFVGACWRNFQIDGEAPIQLRLERQIRWILRVSFIDDTNEMDKKKYGTSTYISFRLENVCQMRIARIELCVVNMQMNLVRQFVLNLN